MELDVFAPQVTAFIIDVITVIIIIVVVVIVTSFYYALRQQAAKAAATAATTAAAKHPIGSSCDVGFSKKKKKKGWGLYIMGKDKRRFSPVFC